MGPWEFGIIWMVLVDLWMGPWGMILDEVLDGVLDGVLDEDTSTFVQAIRAWGSRYYHHLEMGSLSIMAEDYLGTSWNLSLSPSSGSLVLRSRGDLAWFLLLAI